VIATVKALTIVVCTGDSGFAVSLPPSYGIVIIGVLDKLNFQTPSLPLKRFKVLPTVAKGLMPRAKDDHPGHKQNKDPRSAGPFTETSKRYFSGLGSHEECDTFRDLDSLSLGDTFRSKILSR
jgi:hypothetical protein